MNKTLFALLSATALATCSASPALAGTSVTISPYGIPVRESASGTPVELSTNGSGMLVRYVADTSGIGMGATPVNTKGGFPGFTPRPDGTVPGNAQAAFIATQLEPTRIFQRTTAVGGGAGKGTGTVLVPITVTSPGRIWARTRSATDGSVLQAPFQVGNVSTGIQTLSIAGIDARLGWFYVDLSPDGTTWTNGTSPVGMGRLTLLSGQSQMARQIFKVPAYVGTMASLGVAIDPNTSVYARYSEAGRLVTAPVWATPADASAYDSTFLAEFLRRQVAAFGVNCGAIGHAVGNTVIGQWLPGQQNNLDLRGVITAAGGFEAVHLHIGGSDAGASTAPATFQSSLTAVFNDYTAYNTARGANYERYLTTMATRLAAGAGTTANIQAIRKAGLDWSAANAAAYIEPHDINLEDEVHQGQPGSIVLARHLHRATQNNFFGPTLIGSTRAGTAITLLASAPLALVGDVANRFQVYAAGTTATPLTIASATASGNTVTINLSANPGNAQAVDVYWLRHPDPSGTTANANMLYDTFNADGITPGRPLQPSIAAPVATVAAPFADTFTDTAGTSMAAHVPETGQAYTVPTGAMSISSAGTVIAGTVPANALSAFDPGSANCYVEGVFVYNTGANNSMFMIARAADASNCYVLGVESSNSFTIGKFVAGSFTRLQQVLSTLVNGRSYFIRGELVGNTLRLLVDGVEVISLTDNSFAASGKVGLRISAAASTATAGTAITQMAAGSI